MTAASEQTIPTVRLEVNTDESALLSCLSQEQLSFFQTKSEVAAIIVALGGGVGIAAIIRSLAIAIKNYFDGRAEVLKSQTRSIRITVSGKHMEVTAANVSDVEAELLAAIARSDK